MEATLQFPELQCPDHKSPIILVSPDFQEGRRNFLCSRCVASDHTQMKNQDKLLVYDDFVQHLNEQSGLNVQASEESQQLSQQRNENLKGFKNHINSQNKQINELNDQLRVSYEERCKEMVKSLQSTLENEYTVLLNHYERYQEEIQADHEREANIPKFKEIRDQVNQLKNDIPQVESYLSHVVKQKESWKKATQGLRTLGQRTQDYYREQIQNHLRNKPSFVEKQKILELWNDGLKSLIEKVKNQSDCFSGLYQQSEGVILNISNIEELTLLTNQMIKQDTQLTLTFNNQHPLTLQNATQLKNHLVTLTNLRSLHLNLEQSNATNNIHEQIYSGVKELSNLQHLYVNLSGSKAGDNFSSHLGDCLQNLKHLKTLHLDLALNHLTKRSMDNIFNQLSNLKELTHLHLDAKYNDINDISALASNLNLLEKTLIHLSVHLGGFSHNKNKINHDSIKQLINNIRVLKFLRNLQLDLGYIGIGDDLIIELACTLKELEELRVLNLQLYTNDVENRGAAKVAKSCQKLRKLNQVELNLNNNQNVGNQGVKDIVRAFKYMEQLNNLNLYLRNVGAKREEVNKEKQDLEENKVGNKFQTFNFHL